MIGANKVETNDIAVSMIKAYRPYLEHRIKGLSEALQDLNVNNWTGGGRIGADKGSDSAYLRITAMRFFHHKDAKRRVATVTTRFTIGTMLEMTWRDIIVRIPHSLATPIFADAEGNPESILPRIFIFPEEVSIPIKSWTFDNDEQHWRGRIDRSQIASYQTNLEDFLNKIQA